MTARRGLALAGAALACALIAGRILAGAYAEWAWYDALGAGAVWTVRVMSLTTLRAALFAVSFGFALANLLSMRRSIVSLVLPRRLANLEIGEAVPGRALTAMAAVLSLLIAAAVALPQDDWMGFVRAQWAMPLGESDPYLDRDIAFWVGWLPFERTLHEWAVTLGVVVAATVMLLYALTPSVHMQSGRIQVSTWVRRHFAVYSAALLLLVAWGYRLDSFDVLIHGSGTREAFVAFDHRVLYPYLVTLAFGTAAVGLLVAWTGWMGYQRATLWALGLVLVVGPLGRLALPLLNRRAATAGERASLDRPYLHARALYTRRAYGVDNTVRGAAADSLRVPDGELARRVSAWDPAALSRAIADAPGDAAVAGGGAWLVDSAGTLRAVVAYVRGLPGAARGPLVVDEVDPGDADERGAPWLSASPSISAAPALTVGLGLEPVLLVDDASGRTAAPVFGSGWRRVALVWGVRSLRLAFSESDGRTTRLLTRRDVRERVQALAPFFTAGVTPQLLVARDSLWWSVELFSSSADYPLTEPLQMDRVTVHAAVPAGVALVNAHTGRMQVLLPDHPEKMTRWWSDRLPSLFVSRRGVDGALLAALPAPVDRAAVQGNALARTGFRNDTLSVRPLFQADDADVDVLSGPPTPFVSGAPGLPLAWGVPAVDGIDRLRGALVAVGGRDPYIALVEIPDTLRWAAGLDRLQRTANLANLSKGRRHPRRGRVQVVPTVGGLLLVQSFYDWVPDRAPALTGTVLLRSGQDRAAPTLAAALGASPRIGAPDGLRQRVAQVYAQLRDAQRRGDWTAFGRALEALGRIVESKP